jgi:hypothetical protein
MTDEARRAAQWTVYGEGCVYAGEFIVPIFDTNGNHSRKLAKELCDLHNTEVVRLSEAQEALRAWAARLSQFTDHAEGCTRVKMRGLCSCGFARLFDEGAMPPGMDEAFSALARLTAAPPTIFRRSEFYDEHGQRISEALSGKTREVMATINACTPGTRLAEVPTLFAFGPIYDALAEAHCARLTAAPEALCACYDPVNIQNGFKCLKHMTAAPEAQHLKPLGSECPFCHRVGMIVKQYGKDVCQYCGQLRDPDAKDEVTAAPEAQLDGAQLLALVTRVHVILHEFAGTACTDGGWCDARDHAEAILEVVGLLRPAVSEKERS